MKKPFSVRNLTPAEIAERFETSDRVVRRWLREGRFPHAFQLEVTVGRGRPWLVPESDVENFQKPTNGRPQVETASEASKKRRGKRKT